MKNNQAEERNLIVCLSDGTVLHSTNQWLPMSPVQLPCGYKVELGRITTTYVHFIIDGLSRISGNINRLNSAESRTYTVCKLLIFQGVSSLNDGSHNEIL